MKIVIAFNYRLFIKEKWSGSINKENIEKNNLNKTNIIVIEMEMLKLVYPGGQDNEGRLVLNIQLSQPASKEQIETSVKYVLDSFW